MIISKLLGGLGNQMFQFAAGLSAAHRAGCPLRLDIRHLLGYRHHQGYQLPEIFSGDFQKANNLDLLEVLGSKYFKSKKIDISIDPGFPHGKTSKIIKQPTHNFSETFLKTPKSAYLAGYWQSERYFSNVSEEVRAAFFFRLPLIGENARIQTRIRSSNSVSLHIRRGDYLSPSANSFHGVCGAEYYDRAIKYVREYIQEPQFFVFSDEPDEASRLLYGATNFEVINCNSGAESFRDMQLMSQCNHHILANSTFSWWGAWLAQHDKQLVIAPENWFAGSLEPMTDIYLPTWKIM